MIITTGRRFLGAAALILALCHHPAAAETYAHEGDCDGFPRVALKTKYGTCIGLVAEHLGFARGVAVLGTDLYVADMGGWRKGKGRILRLADQGHGAPAPILTGLDEPNELMPGPDGTLYIGVLGRIIRFDPTDPAAPARDIVVGLPSDGRHPLVAFAVAPDGSLFVNVGSATDHCEGAHDAKLDAAKPCPETLGKPPRGAILHIPPGTSPVDASTITPYATGLRNNMALTVLGNGTLLAAANARDFIDQADPTLSDEEEPHDTFDRVDEGADYGWPYCYDNNVPSPEYRSADCAAKHAPTLLLPPHAAPLGMLVYHGMVLPGLDGRLVMGFHGYRARGHRLMLLPIGGDGRPNGVLDQLVSGWDAAKGSHPQGAPVALAEAPDGSLLVTEDRNGTLLRLARASP